MKTLRRTVGLLMVAGALGACASATPDGEPEDPAVSIEVVNGLKPNTALTVSVTEAAGREALGTVVPSGRRTFRFHPRDMAYTGFSLVAETGTGREITSPTFTLREDAEVVWDVEANTVEPR